MRENRVIIKLKEENLIEARIVGQNIIVKVKGLINTKDYPIQIFAGLIAKYSNPRRKSVAIKHLGYLPNAKCFLAIVDDREYWFEET